MVEAKVLYQLDITKNLKLIIENEDDRLGIKKAYHYFLMHLCLHNKNISRRNKNVNDERLPGKISDSNFLTALSKSNLPLFSVFKNCVSSSFIISII